MSTNIIEKCNDALWNKTFANGLSSYTQANCQVTLTDEGYRIYRPPNKSQSADGNTMWGGLVIRPFDANANAMVKGHTYIIKFDLKGKTSVGVSSEIYWTNNCGWSGTSYGLGTNPTNISFTAIPNDWVSEEWYPFQYKFTISDDIIKTCTKSYSSFVEGTAYNTYRDFKFGFGYTTTGAMGTDLYLRNFRLYDITTLPNNTNITKQGIVVSDNFVEAWNQVSIKCDGDLYASHFIEI